MKTKLSPWIPDEEGSTCCMRVLADAPNNDLQYRVAFIEKSARVRVAPYTNDGEDYRNWRSGFRGWGCGGDRDAIKEQAYGYYPPSREWCDAELEKLGYDIS